MKKLLLSLAVLLSASFSTLQAEDWILRLGMVNVSPNDTSGAVLGNDGVQVGDDSQFGFTLTYMLDDNWGIELLGANPFSHSLTGTGALAGLPIGSTKHLPPTLTALYQFDTEGDTIYHVGAGINYTKFFEDYSSPELRSALGTSVDLDLSSSTGLALNAGFDTPISDNWYLSGSIWYLMIETDAGVYLGGANTSAVTVNVDIDPWVLMLGLSTRF